MSKTATNRTKIKQRIEELERQSEFLKSEIEKELEVTKTKVSDYSKIALGIGGGLIFSIIVLGSLIGQRKNKGGKSAQISSKRVYHRFRDQLTHELTSQATDFLLNVAKDKLSAHFEQKEKNTDDSAHSS